MPKNIVVHCDLIALILRIEAMHQKRAEELARKNAGIREQNRGISSYVCKMEYFKQVRFKGNAEVMVCSTIGRLARYEAGVANIYADGEFGLICYHKNKDNETLLTVGVRYDAEKGEFTYHT